MLFTQAFKQASNDRAMKVPQLKPSSKLPCLTESRGEMALKFLSSFIKLHRVGFCVRRGFREAFLINKTVSLYLKTEVLLSL